jgi:hypothetical protein
LFLHFKKKIEQPSTNEQSQQTQKLSSTTNTQQPSNNNSIKITAIKDLECISITDSASDNSNDKQQEQEQNATDDSLTLPVNISPQLKQLTMKFVNEYQKRVAQAQKLWTDDMKAQMLELYTEGRKLNKTDSSQFFRFVAARMGKAKETLFKHCRRLLQEKQQQKVDTSTYLSTSQNNMNSASMPQQSPSKLSMSFNSSPSATSAPSSSPSLSLNITISDFSQDLRNKLITLKNEFHAFKQKSIGDQTSGSSQFEPVKFFDLPKVQELIFNVENFIRIGNACPSHPQLKAIRIRDLCYTFMAASFEMRRDAVRECYSKTMNAIRRRNFELNLKRKMQNLKNEIDKQMPKSEEKYKRSMDEYHQIASATIGTDKPKPSFPRKRFEWTDDLKKLCVDIIDVKMNIYKTEYPFNGNQSVNQSPSSSQSQQQQAKSSEKEAGKKLEYISTFFDQDFLLLWPKNWMQKNVLLSMYQKYLNQQQLQQQQQQHQTHQNHPQKKPINNQLQQQQQQVNTTNQSTPKIQSQQSSSMSSQQKKNSMTSSSSNPAFGATSTFPSTPKSTLNNNLGNNNNNSSSHQQNPMQVISVSSKSGKQIKIEPQVRFFLCFH